MSEIINIEKKQVTDIDKLIELVYQNPAEIDLLMAQVVDLFLRFDINELETLINKLQALIIKLECTIDLTSYYNVVEAFKYLPNGNYLKCVEILQSSLLRVKSEKNRYLESIIYAFQGLSYRSVGESSLALQFHFQSVELTTDGSKCKNLNLINQYQIGEIYSENGDYKEAKEFFLNNLSDIEDNKNKNSFFFRVYSGLINICLLEDKIEDAKKYLDLSKLYLSHSDVNTSRHYSDLSSYHFQLREYDTAINFENKSLKIREKRNSHDPISSCHIMLGKCYLAKNDNKLALEHTLNAFELCKRLQTKNKLLKVHKLLSSIHKSNGDFEIAFTHLEKLLLLTDEIKIKQNKTNNTLKNKLVVSQKEEFEETVTQLSASINYAERIQRAMMQPAKNLAKLLPESFIFLKPHSVISGDFYWFAEVNNKIVIAAADCTGHGVPAGLLTMKLHGLLTRLVIELKHTVPNDILVNLHQKLHFDLDYENSKIEDGMDVSIVSIDKEIGEIQYAGARRPLVIVDNGIAKTIAADRKSIGGELPVDLSFTNHSLPISHTANYFMYSDGYIDQFGGDNDKKYKTSQLLKLLEVNHQKSMSEHVSLIEKDFMTWRGIKKRKLTPQTDDVLVIGFKIDA